MAVGFGIIGCGAIAQWHALGIAACPGARLVGVTDFRPEVARAFAAGHGCRAFETLTDMLSAPGVQAVCICTPSGLHASQGLMALEAGRHVLMEKPLALSVEDADLMIEAAKKRGLVLAVVSQMRFSKPLLRLKEAVEEGLLGRITTADVSMKYFRDPAYYAGSNWRGTWKMDGGGALMNQGIHGVDAILHVMGGVRHLYGLAETLFHSIEVEDTATAVLQFENGALGTIQGTTSVYPGYPRRLSVSGTEGTITITETLFEQWDIKDRPMPPDIQLGGSQRTGASSPMDFDVHGHEMHIWDMVEAIETSRPPMVSGEEARRAVRLICAIYESARTGKRVYLS